MKNATTTTVKGAAALLAAIGMAGCGDDGGLGASSTLNLGITDGPVTDATVVWIQFTGVEVKPVNGSPELFTFSPAKGYDLLTLQNGNAATLLGDTTVPAGDYEWLRLIIDPTPDSSYVENGSGVHGLKIPSGVQSGLKLIQGFTMPAGGRADFTIDFVLDKSIIAPPGLSPQYLMKPVLRMTNNVEVGSIGGNIGAVALAANSGCAAAAPRVYLYEGEFVVPDDIFNPLEGGDDTAPEVDPLVTAVPVLDGSGGYDYYIGFVKAGTYTVAFTCDDDDPAVDEDAEPATPLEFTTYASPVAVSVGETSTADFQ